MSFLDDLSMGLKQAGRVLSAPVSEDLSKQENLQSQQQFSQLQQMQAQLIKGIESGAIAPEQGNAALAKFGYKGIPIGLSPEAQARMEAVKKERDWQVAAREAGGDPVKLVAAASVYKPELAVQLYNQQEDRARRMKADAATLEVKKQQLLDNYDIKQRQLDILERQGADKNEIARSLATLRAETDRARIALERESNSIKAQTLQLQTQLMKMRLGQQAQTQNNEIARRAGQMTTAFERAELPQMNATLENIEKALRDPKVNAEYLTGPKSAVPDFAAGAENRAARQALQQLFNITLKSRSGAAVTNQELERLKVEFGQGKFKTTDQIIGAVERARGIFIKHAQGIAAGFGLDALKYYNENLEAIGAKPFVVESAKSNQQQGPSGAPKQVTEEEYNALPSGAQYIAPDGSTRTKR